MKVRCPQVIQSGEGLTLVDIHVVSDMCMVGHLEQSLRKPPKELGWKALQMDQNEIPRIIQVIHMIAKKRKNRKMNSGGNKWKIDSYVIYVK